MHPEDAAALGVGDGEIVWLETAVGEAPLPAQLDARMQAGFVSVPNGFGVSDEDGQLDGINLNELMAAGDRDPFTGCPHHKHVACRVRKRVARLADPPESK
jgi:formate dehydrogenase